MQPETKQKLDVKSTRKAREDKAYKIAKHTALERLVRGSHLGGGSLPSKDELHDRAAIR